MHDKSMVIFLGLFHFQRLPRGDLKVIRKGILINQNVGGGGGTRCF